MVISVRDDIDSPLSMPGADHRFAGTFRDAAARLTLLQSYGYTEIDLRKWLKILGEQHFLVIHIEFRHTKESVVCSAAN